MTEMKLVARLPLPVGTTSTVTGPVGPHGAIAMAGGPVDGLVDGPMVRLLELTGPGKRPSWRVVQLLWGRLGRCDAGEGNLSPFSVSVSVSARALPHAPVDRA